MTYSKASVAYPHIFEVLFHRAVKEDFHFSLPSKKDCTRLMQQLHAYRRSLQDEESLLYPAFAKITLSRKDNKLFFKSKERQAEELLRNSGLDPEELAQFIPEKDIPPAVDLDQYEAEVDIFNRMKGETK